MRPNMATLSSATGTVKVVFREEGDAIVVDWTERGGPIVAAPEGGEGFGTVLSRIAVSHQRRRDHPQLEA